MKNINLSIYCFLFLFCGFTMMAHAQKYHESKKVSQKNYDDDPYEEEYRMQDITWKQKGFEIFFGAGIYFANKKTATYYNGVPGNDINLNLLWNNEYYRENQLIPLLKRVYTYVDNIVIEDNYTLDPQYNIAMDISLGAKYRFQKNWYLELSYSFRRLTSESRFNFIFPGVPEGNKENPPYSKNEGLVAKEDRHYIDFSIGYIFQQHPVAKPFISIGGQFTFVNLKSFLAIIEDQPFDLLALARYPYYNGIDPVPNYRVWAGSGYGFSLTAGLKIAFNQSASIDPFFQFSVASFGNSANLPGFYTMPCFNYVVGIRLVMSDALFSQSVKR